jgi:hypothetical protein
MQDQRTAVRLWVCPECGPFRVTDEDPEGVECDGCGPVGPTHKSQPVASVLYAPTGEA